MASTRARFRELIGREIGGWWDGTVDLAPSVTELDAQRVILSNKLSRLERPPNDMSMAHAWVGRYGESRQILLGSFRNLPTLLLTPPASGPLTMTVWGLGEVGPITLTGSISAKATQLQDAITDLPGLESVTVSASGTDLRIEMPSEEYTAEVDAGTIKNGFGRVEASSAWRSALAVGTPWEICYRLPIEDDGSQSGLNYIVNQALGFVTTIAQVPYTLNHNEQIIEIEEPWLRTEDQIHAIWYPYRRMLTALFVPPVSGTYDLTLEMGLDDDLVIADLPSTASNTTISEAIAAALGTAGLDRACEVTGTSTRTIKLADVYYASATISASAGTISSQTLVQLDPRLRYDGYKFVPNRHRRQLELDCTFRPGASMEIEMSCRAVDWTCPQVDWQTTGTTWSTSENGLVDDLDQADADEETVKLLGSWLACKELAKGDPDTAKTWNARAETYAEGGADLLLKAVKPTQANSRASRTYGFRKGRSGLVDD